MSYPIIQGTAGPVTTSTTRYGYSPQRGFYTVETIFGTAANIQALLPGLVSAGATYDVKNDENGATCKLEITYGSDRVTGQNPEEASYSDTWELINSMREIPILEAPGAASISKDDRKIINAFIKTGVETSATLTGDALYAYELATIGVTHVPTRDAVIRHTRTVNAAYAGKANNANADKILSRATLQAEGIPNAILWNLTDFLDTTGITKVDFNASNVFDYGWLKSYANVTQQSWNSWQFQNEYKFGLWSRFIYGARV